MTKRVFDRLEEFDERSRSFSIREVVAELKPRSYTWACDTFLDQGREGACVGFAWVHEAIARPVIRKATEQDALALYNLARKLDSFPGENHEGTSIIAGAKAARELGYLSEFRWAFNTLDALAGISRRGPAVLGVNWYEGMFQPDAQGFIRPTGRIIGGHAILATGVSVKNGTVTLHNSWGRDWGVRGRARMTWEDFDSLLQARGECCIPVRRL